MSTTEPAGHSLASEPAQQAGGWLSRPVARHHVLLAVGLAALAWLAAVLVSLAWASARWQSQVHLTNLPLALSLRAGITAEAEITSTVKTWLKANPNVTVVLDQTVAARLSDTLRAQAHVDTTLAVATTVSYAADVPVATEVTLDVPVVSWLPAMRVTLPLATVVPIRASVPVQVTVPLTLDMQVQAQLPGALRLPLQTQLTLSTPLNLPMQARVLSQIPFVLRSPIDELPVVVTSTTLALPWRQVQLLQRPKPP